MRFGSNFSTLFCHCEAKWDPNICASLSGTAAAAQRKKVGQAFHERLLHLISAFSPVVNPFAWEGPFVIWYMLTTCGPYPGLKISKKSCQFGHQITTSQHSLTNQKWEVPPKPLYLSFHCIWSSSIHLSFDPFIKGIVHQLVSLASQNPWGQNWNLICFSLGHF